VSKFSVLTVLLAVVRLTHHIVLTVFLLLCGTQCRDLGVTITSDLSSSQHINEITAKAYKRTICIFRRFASRDVKLLVRAFTVYVRPISNRESPEAFHKKFASAP